MKYLLLYNPKSGKGKFKKKIPYIKSEFKKRGLILDLFESNKQYDLENYAKENSSKYDCLIVSGGDGSINEVINGIMNSNNRPILSIIPSGTANDTAGIFKIKKNIKKALKIIFENDPIKMDINKINDKYFIYTTAAGVLTKISYDISRKSIKKYGYLAYVSEGAKDIFKDYKIDMEVEYEGGVVKGTFMLVLALAAKRVGGFRLRRFSKAKLNDGKLEFRLIRHRRFFKLQKIVFFFIAAGKKNKHDISLYSSYYNIKTNHDVVWNIDGERGLMGSVRIDVLKEELPVLINKKSKKEYF